ncbi:hypothetical protein Pelo_8965 [Pelomyxa schiedti]|nr:hypothetical protein Pelo_8965 [Pelomyxa schiedti]
MGDTDVFVEVRLKGEPSEEYFVVKTVPITITVAELMQHFNLTETFELWNLSKNSKIDNRGGQFDVQWSNYLGTQVSLEVRRYTRRKKTAPPPEQTTGQITPIMIPPCQDCSAISTGWCLACNSFTCSNCSRNRSKHPFEHKIFPVSMASMH